MAIIFAKTTKGHAEIETRSGALSPRVRRVLIFVDGKRPVEELRNMLHYDDLQHTLGLLEEDGFIEMVGISGAGGSPLPPDAAPPSGVFRLHPPGDDARVQRRAEAPAVRVEQAGAAVEGEAVGDLGLDRRADVLGPDIRAQAEAQRNGHGHEARRADLQVLADQPHRLQMRGERGAQRG